MQSFYSVKLPHETLLFYGLYRHLDIEMLNANLVHHVRTAKGSASKLVAHP